jgi:hypothetical protein
VSLDPGALHLAVRWLHVCAMAVAFGGAVLVLVTTWNRLAPVVVAVALGYEWAFWGALGVLAMTGIGNLGAFGVTLPEPATPWGQTLVVKLATVMALAIVSVPRTLAVIALSDRGETAVAPVSRLRALYAISVVAFAIIVALAEMLAHR